MFFLCTVIQTIPKSTDISSQSTFAPLLPNDLLPKRLSNQTPDSIKQPEDQIGCYSTEKSLCFSIKGPGKGALRGKRTKKRERESKSFLPRTHAGSHC